MNAYVSLPLCALCVLGGESFHSGLQPGQRPGPYAAVIVTGPERGQSYCYVCETADRPAVVVFARTVSEPLGRLVHQLDQAVAAHQAAGLRAWVTVLHPDQAALDSAIVGWAKRHAIRAVPVGVFEDAVGPPSYRLSRDADVTVLLYAKRRVAANFAFRAGELNDARIAEVVKALPQVTGGK